jgi:gamma-glutamylcyclotransferase (GGCT)/AIG2-like uncharacterized protein YtfP
VIRHLFVYGTLRPGDVRWHLLEPFVVDDGWPDRVAGTLFDTGFDYPAAVFGGDALIHGHTFTLLESSLERALEVLDEVEGVVDGEYARTTVRTERGIDAWAYAGGDGLVLTPIPSGDWFLHRPPPAPPPPRSFA